MTKTTLTVRRMDVRARTYRAMTVSAALLLALAPMPAPRAHDQSHLQAPVVESHADHNQSMDHGRPYKLSLHRYTVPDVTLLDMHGSEVSLAQVLEADAPTMMNFIFTSCTSICPILSVTFSQAQALLAEDLGRTRMISISIDPEYDRPRRLREYARTHHAGSQWNFLTGRPEDIVAVQKAFDVYRGNKMSHEPFTFLRASRDEAWTRIDGFLSASEIVREYHNLVDD